jgi:hypothetical protein
MSRKAISLVNWQQNKYINVCILVSSWNPRASMNLNLWWLIQVVSSRLGIACAILKEKALLNHHQCGLVISAGKLSHTWLSSNPEGNVHLKCNPFS